MKQIIRILAVLLMLGLSSQAQNAPAGEKYNYVVSTTKIPQLQPILLTAEALKKEDGERFGDFQIVMYGPNVKKLTDTEAIEKYMSKAEAVGASLHVCRISLDRLNIDPVALHQDIEVVEHAYTHLLQLQSKNKYYSLQL